MTEEENIARMFHDYYEELAPSFGYETRKDTKQFDANSSNGRLMIAVSKKVLDSIKKRYFVDLDY